MPEISMQQRVQDKLKQRFRDEPMRVAKYIGVPSDVEIVSGAKERALFWTKDPNIERNADAYLQQARQAAEAQKLPIAQWRAKETAGKNEPETVTAARAQRFFEEELPEDTELRALTFFGNMLYPARADLIRSGARLFDTDAQKKFSDDMAKLGPPEGSE